MLKLDIGSHSSLVRSRVRANYCANAHLFEESPEPN